ncbi:MAG TPA: thioredoxin domain-containing protein [Gemmatimonadales bacterium]|nr:thioredoxin domain-containing protein [Gemmatimonadales bacterium]
MSRALALVVGLVAFAATALAAQQNAKPDSQVSAKKDILAERSLGSATAPVTVYEMSDFQCPYCRRHTVDVFPTLDQAYVKTGKIRWIFINFPLTSIHANAAAAAELGLCAARVGKFWPIHDLLFKYQDAWAPLKEPGPFLLSLADSVGAANSSIQECLTAGAARPEIEADADGARRAGAQSTPSFYIEGGLLVGSQPVEVWKHILDSIYTAKTARK